MALFRVWVVAAVSMSCAGAIDEPVFDAGVLGAGGGTAGGSAGGGSADGSAGGGSAGGSAGGGSAGGSAGGATQALPSVTLSSPVAGSSLGFSFGQVFVKGAVPAGTRLGLDFPEAQVTWVSTWDDGSLKHALVAGRVTLGSSTPRAVGFRVVSGAAAVPMTEAQLQARNPQAAVSYGAYGTVTLSSLIGTSALARIERAGPEYAELQYLAAFPADASLEAVFYVQLWAGGQYRVRVAVENGRDIDSSTAKSGLASVTIANVTRFSGQVSMPQGVRWDVVGASGPEVTVSHDPAYLRSTRLVPNYGFTTPAPATLAALSDSYAPMSRLRWEQDMGATGYTQGIGLLPHWDALYATTGDPRALRLSVEHSRALGSYSIFFRDSATGAFPRFSQHPTAYSNSEGLTGNGSNPNRWEIAHHPHAGYLAWLMTAERFHLETLQVNAWTAWYTCSGAGRSGVDKLYNSQTRARAWRFRTIASTAAVSPDSDPFKTDCRRSVAANLAGWKASYVDAGLVPTGLGATYADLEPSQPGLQISLFEHLFLAASVGWGWEQELQLDTNERAVFQAVRDYFYRVPVGLTGAGAASNQYCYRRATGPYRVTIGASATTYFQTWAEVESATYGAPAACASGSALEGSYIDSNNDYSFAQGNWGHVVTALSYAVDHGAAGATAGYGRVTNASNWAGNATYFNDLPQYGVVRH